MHDKLVDYDGFLNCVSVHMNDEYGKRDDHFSSDTSDEHACLDESDDPDEYNVFGAIDDHDERDDVAHDGQGEHHDCDKPDGFCMLDVPDSCEGHGARGVHCWLDRHVALHCRSDQFGYDGFATAP